MTTLVITPSGDIRKSHFEFLLKVVLVFASIITRGLTRSTGRKAFFDGFFDI